MPFDRGQCQIPYPSPGPKGWGFQLTGASVPRLKTQLEALVQNYEIISYISPAFLDKQT